MNKRISAVLYTILLISCIACTENNKPKKIQKMVKDIATIDTEDISGSEPLSITAKDLEMKADKVISIDKSNIKESLEEASRYSQSIIFVGEYTLIRITSFDDCQQSTLWGTCMPKGTALIQRSGAITKEDGYINNMLGKPGTQTCKLLLFK